jgi:hypothetical protein
MKKAFAGMKLEPTEYLEDFKKDFGKYPTLVLDRFAQLPTRYRAKNGRKKFRMVGYEEGAHFKVTSIEPGKRVPLNVVCVHIAGGHELVLEPRLLKKYFSVMASSKSSRPISEHKKTSEHEAPRNPKLAEIIAQRRKEAQWVI